MCHYTLDLIAKMYTLVFSTSPETVPLICPTPSLARDPILPAVLDMAEVTFEGSIFLFVMSEMRLSFSWVPCLQTYRPNASATYDSVLYIKKNRFELQKD